MKTGGRGNGKVGRILLAAVRIGLGVALLGYVLSRAGNWEAAKQFLSHPWVWPMLLTWAFFGAALEALRLRLLLKSQGISLPFGAGFRLVAISTFFSFCIPGGTGGDVVKFYYLSSERRGQRVEIATMVLLDRVAGLISLLLLVVVLGAFNLDLLRESALIRLLVFSALGGLLALVGIGAISSSERLRRGKLYSYLVTRIPLHRYVARVADAFYVFRHYRSVPSGAILLSLLGHGLLCGLFLVVGSYAIPQVPARQLCLLALLGMLANALPVTPGGLGVGEAAFDALFKTAGFAGGAQLILVWRAAMLGLCVLGFLFYAAGRRYPLGRVSVSRKRGFGFESQAGEGTWEGTR